MGRLDRVNEQLKREIGTILQKELGDPRLEFVSITKADISKDLRYAKVYFNVIGDERKKEAAQAGLNKAKRLIRKYVAQRIQLRFIPDLSFFYDEGMLKETRIEEILKEIHDGLQKDSENDQESS